VPLAGDFGHSHQRIGHVNISSEVDFPKLGM
jgi:hypothetical protein